MKRILIVAAMVIAAFGASYAQESDAFKPSGKASAKLFTNYHSTFTDGESQSAFDLTRAYFGYQYQMTETFSGKVLLDVGNPEDGGKLEMTAYLKNAYVQYKDYGFTVQFGLVGTKQFKVQESAWGYRYIAKSFQDEYKFGSSADLGLTVAYKVCDKFSADVSVLNGEGYKKLQSDSIFKYGLGLTATPIDGLTLRGYVDVHGDDDKQTNIAAFVGYETGDLSLGAEYIMSQNFKMSDGDDLSGISLYATYGVSDNLGVFGRYDELSSNDDWNISKDGSKIIAGLEYAAAKGVKIAPNFQMWSPAADGADDVVSAYLNLEIKF